MLLLLSCYTVLQPPKLSEEDREIQEMFSLKFSVNEELIGSWTRTYVIADGPRVTPIINFTSLGDLSYYSNLGVLRNECFLGKFKTNSDTLIIKFNDKHSLEKFIFKVDKGFLQLSRLEPLYHEKYFLEVGDQWWKRLE